jgi:hypothetical protein
MVTHGIDSCIMHPDTTILAATIHNDLSNAIVWSGKNAMGGFTRQ